MADDPECHRVCVRTHHAEAETVGLVNRCTATHERVCYHSRQLVEPPVTGLQRLRAVVLGKQEAAEQRTWAAGEPLVYPDDRAIVLLYLLFPEREAGGKRRIEMLFEE